MDHRVRRMRQEFLRATAGSYGLVSGVEEYAVVADVKMLASSCVTTTTVEPNCRADLGSIVQQT